MSAVPAHPSDPGGAKRQGKAASGRRGRRHGVEIKPGTVKQARAEAGLSLGQVAQGDISRTAIYFVETGKAKPSIETLALIAERTGKSVDFFLAEPAGERTSHAATVAQVERLLSTGDHAGVIAAARPALARRPDPETAARIRSTLAMAYLRSAQVPEGRREASLARAHYERTGDLLMTAECLGTEAQAASLQLDPGALGLAEAGLAACRAMKPVPSHTEARLLAIVGAVNVANRDWDRAIESYEQAVAVGNVVQDLRSLSMMYGNLSVAYQETGRLNEAVRYADRALAVYETLNDRLALARYENNLALLIFGQGHLPDALRHAQRSLAIFEDMGVEAGKAHILMTLSELSFAESDLAEAERYAREAREAADRTGEDSNVGEATLWLARIAEANGNRAGSDAAFAAALEMLAQAGPAERIGRAHAIYADVLEARGDLLAANAHLRRALMSTQGRRASTEARAVSA
ncbi:MAG TPA: tetratricopeptide repeat protein [Candidatus Dormibacteraeota bacterium]|nr:tetratricopeptide repeat protein [Candidatus Dormibacteraeota bacterium]